MHFKCPKTPNCRQTRLFFHTRNPSAVTENVCHSAHVQLILDEETLTEVEYLDLARLVCDLFFGIF